jgi:hypothetical protein
MNGPMPSGARALRRAARSANDGAQGINAKDLVHVFKGWPAARQHAFGEQGSTHFALAH